MVINLHTRVHGTSKPLYLQLIIIFYYRTFLVNEDGHLNFWEVKALINSILSWAIFIFHHCVTMNLTKVTAKYA